MAGAEGPLWLLQGHQRQGRRPRGRVCEAGDAGGLRRAGACGAAEQGGAKYPKNDGILAAKGVDWKHAESRLVQGLASLNSQQGTSLRLVSGESEKPETYTRAGSAIRPYTARADLGDLFAEEEKLIARAKAEGFFWDTAQVDKIKSGLGDSGGGTEHDVWFVNEQKDGRIVIRSTILDSYGFQGRSPAQYLKRLEDYNQAFPALQTRLIGVSRNARGNGSSGRRSRSWKRWNSRMTNAFKACWRKRL